MSWKWSGGANGPRAGAQDYFSYLRTAADGRGEAILTVQRARGDGEISVAMRPRDPSVRVYVDLRPDDARELAAALVAAANIEDPEAAAAAPAPRDGGNQ